MNDLQNSKKILESKIAHRAEIIADKQRLYDFYNDQVKELRDTLVVLNQEQWKDEFSLEAVNKEISEIPTLAYRKLLK